MELKANKIADYDDLKNPGDFMFTRVEEADPPAGLYYICPCGKHDGYLPFKHEDLTTSGCPTWNFDGNEEEPTLSPSILDRGCGYHGHLIKGVWISC